MKRMTFELGGKSPNVIFADADLESAIEGAHFALYFNQGQCCCAGSRLFVEERVHDEVIDRIKEKNKERKVGDPFDPETQQGPQVDEAQFDKVLQYVEHGKKDGASCVTGGKRVGSKGYFVEPTLFTDVTDDMRIAREEIFGPVMSVLKFKNVDEIIRRSNDTNFGLAAAVWTRDVAKAHRYAKEVRAGTVWVNCYDVFDAAAPFGGFKESGLGRELGEAGLAAYTELKTVTVAMT
jgi:aldehyde dehydrogenase (NAD+)